MPQFVPSKETPKSDKPPTQSSTPPADGDKIAKAEEAARLQDLETQRIKSLQEAKFAEFNIQSVEDLEAGITAFTERKEQLIKEITEFENKKSTELSDIQKQKAENEKRNSELNKKAQDLAFREHNLEVREKIVADREALLNSVQQKQFEDTEKYNSLTEQLKRVFPRISGLMGDNANLFIQVGYAGLGEQIWDEIEAMERWSKADIDKNCETIVTWLKGEVEDCNRIAVEMAHNPQSFNGTHNQIVDRLEEIYKLLPELKPEYLPSSDNPPT